MGARADSPPRRLEHLDWMRGIAVLLMIDVHLFDSWTASADRDSRAFAVTMLIGGAGTTLFLFLAGVSVALSAGSKLRRTGNAGLAARGVALRGLEIFALAFVFRLQAWFLGWSHRPMDLLKVDVLNIMGPSIAAAAALWHAGGSPRRRWLTFAAAAAVTSFLTPALRSLPPGLLPEPVFAYIVPVAGLSNFVFFPWAAFVFAGACVGVLIEGSQGADRDTTYRRLAIGGAAVTAIAAIGSSLPSPFPASDFWTTSPAYLFLRGGLATMAVAGSEAWIRMRGDGSRWSPLTQLGRTSLFIYWIHVELVYGLISRPWHHGLTLAQAFGAYLAVCALMLVCSVLKERVARWYSRPALPQPADQAFTAVLVPTRSQRSSE